MMTLKIQNQEEDGKKGRSGGGGEGGERERDPCTEKVNAGAIYTQSKSMHPCKLIKEDFPHPRIWESKQLPP